MLQRRSEKTSGGMKALVGMSAALTLLLSLQSFEKTSSTSLMHKVDTQVNVLGALNGAIRAFRPGGARFIVGKDSG